MMKKAKLITVFAVLITISAVVYIGLVIHEFNNTKIEFIKEYYEITVDDYENVDYMMFLEPTEKYDVLYSIDENTRKQISEYMKSNNLRLKPGIHRFHRINYTKDILIKDFTFEKGSHESENK